MYDVTRHYPLLRLETVCRLDVSHIEASCARE